MKAVSAPLIVAAAAAGAVADASWAQAPAGRARHPTAPPTPIADNVRNVRLMVAFSAAGGSYKAWHETLPRSTLATMAGTRRRRPKRAEVPRREERRVKSENMDGIGTTLIR